MASVRVAEPPGPHRLDSDPRLFLHELTARSGRKENMMFGTSCPVPGSVRTTEPATGSPASLNLPVSPRREALSLTEERRRPAGERCALQSSRPPRCPVTDSQRRSPDCDTERGGRDTGRDTGRAETDTRQTERTRDFNSNIERESGQSTGVRPGSSLKKTVTNPTSSASVSNGHHGRGSHALRDTMPGSTGQPSAVDPEWITGGGSDETDGPPGRLTRGRTGVVRLARTEPHRREAWSIFPISRGARGEHRDGDRDPRAWTERGEGHRFGPRPVTQDWCDACSRQITAHALKCGNCSYTCHLECEHQVQLDCNQRDRKPRETPSPSSHCSTPSHHGKKNEKEKEGEERKDENEKEGEERGTQAQEEVQAGVEEYNSRNSDSCMKLAPDGSYTGFIKVHLRLSRPVTVPGFGSAHLTDADVEEEAGSGPAPAQEGAGPRPSGGDGGSRTSFYLPRGCVKHLHVSSSTTVSEVIQALLKTHRVLDHPRKFALYRHTHRNGQDLFQKLPLCEHPLSLRLRAGPDQDQGPDQTNRPDQDQLSGPDQDQLTGPDQDQTRPDPDQLTLGPDQDQLTFVLKENETGDVEWDNFSVPELLNFLVILGKEETERVRALEQKYAAYRQRLQRALRQHDP